MKQFHAEKSREEILNKSFFRGNFVYDFHSSFDVLEL